MICNQCNVNDATVTIMSLNTTTGETTVKEEICSDCDDGRMVNKFLETGEISSSLWLAAELDVHSGRWSRVPEPTARKIVASLEKVRAALFAVPANTIQSYREAIALASHGLSGETQDFKVLAMETAGRGLVTVSDAKPGGKFGGAWITFIFDATSRVGDLRGRWNIQGLCASESEAIGLVNAFGNEVPQLTEGSVSIL
jgi:hypothetical protein